MPTLVWRQIQKAAQSEVLGVGASAMEVLPDSLQADAEAQTAGLWATQGAEGAVGGSTPGLHGLTVHTERIQASGGLWWDEQLEEESYPIWEDSADEQVISWPIVCGSTKTWPELWINKMEYKIAMEVLPDCL